MLASGAFVLVIAAETFYIGATQDELRNFAMAVRSARNIEKSKKKKHGAIPRAKVTRIQGNTLAARRRLKKLAGKARAAKAAAAAK
jgi:hypothetical protein